MYNEKEFNSFTLYARQNNNESTVIKIKMYTNGNV